MNKPLVSVCIITYNHEPFIRDCIEGALNQKIGYPYEIIIGEDCSTDKTKEICFEYARLFPEEITLICNPQNLGMSGNWVKSLNKCNGRYIAICEGDDFWTDPDKLQKQVDFLEANTNYGLIHSGYLNCNNKGEKSSPFLQGQSDLHGYVFEKLLIQNRIGTLTVVARKSLINKAIKCYQSIEDKIPLYDIFLWLYCSYNNKIAFLEDITAVYRSIKGSASYPTDPVNRARFLVDISKIELFYATNYLVSQEIKEAVIIKANKRSLYLNFLLESRRNFFNNLFNLLKLRSVSKKDLIFTVGLFIPFVNKVIKKRVYSIY